MSLIERIEQAEGPSRELDAEIAKALGHTVELVTVMARKPYREWSTVHDDEGPASVTRPVPRYTSSIDAALTLLPDGFRYSEGTWDGYPNSASACVSLPSSMAPHFYGDAATPALALAAAALKAKEANDAE